MSLTFRVFVAPFCNRIFALCECVYILRRISRLTISSDERLVMRHYLSKTVHIIIAFESDHRPWNPWLSIHAPLAFQHLPG